MRKIINLYSIVLVVIFLSVRVEALTTAEGKSFFAPQSLMAILAPLSMRPQLIMSNIEPEKSRIVHLRPLLKQPELEMLPSALSSPMPTMPSLGDRSEWSADKPEASNDGPETPQAMPLDALTIPLNDVELSDTLTIPLNEVVEPRMMPESLSYDAPDLNDNGNYLMQDLSHDQDTSMNLGQMQILPNPTPKNGLTFAITPFYIRSTNGSDLRHYFFPGGKDELSVKGSVAAGALNDCDVSGTWLNIAGPGGANLGLLRNSFQSTLQISPTYEYAGAHLHVRKQIGRYWSDVQLPVAQVRVDHGIKEYSVSGNVGKLEEVPYYNHGNAAHVYQYANPLFSVDAASAFSQSSWQYQKLSKKPLKHAGMGDATVKIGMNYGRAQFFTKFVIPSGQQQTNAFLFEPQLGNGGHLGLGSGATWTYVTKINCLDGILGVQGEFDCTYLFSNSQMRTFDLSDYGSFSRFLQFRAFDGIIGKLPSYAGVNTLTKKTIVSPRGEINALLASSFVRKDIQFGLTYSLHGTFEESLKINDSFTDTYGVASTDATPALVVGPNLFASPGASINQSAYANPQANPGSIIRIEDLDLSSATRPGAATSQIAASFGFQKNWWSEDVGIHCTTGMSINHNNATLSTWLIALQIALKL